MQFTRAPIETMQTALWTSLVLSRVLQSQLLYRLELQELFQ